MTLLNHIGMFVIIVLICIICELFDAKSTLKNIDKVTIPILVAIFLFIIFESFYWTFKIFF